MPWTPANLFTASDTGGWYDFSDTGTLYQDSAGTTPVTATGQNIGRVVPKVGSGAGFNFTQSTSSARPVYTLNSGQGYALFDGGDWLDSGLSRFGRSGLYAASSESWSVYVVASADNSTILARCSGTAGNKTFQLLSYPSANNLSFAARGGIITDFDTASTDASPLIGGICWTGSVFSTRIRNDIRNKTASVGTAAEESTQRIILGARTNGTAHFLTNGAKVWQLFIIDRALTSTEEDNLLYYMGSKAGVTTVGVQAEEPSGVTGTVASSSTHSSSSAVSLVLSGTTSSFSQSSCAATTAITLTGTSTQQSSSSVAYSTTLRLLGALSSTSLSSALASAYIRVLGTLATQTTSSSVSAYGSSGSSISVATSTSPSASAIVGLTLSGTASTQSSKSEQLSTFIRNSGACSSTSQSNVSISATAYGSNSVIQTSISTCNSSASLILQAVGVTSFPLQSSIAAHLVNSAAAVQLPSNNISANVVLRLIGNSSTSSSSTSLKTAQLFNTSSVTTQAQSEEIFYAVFSQGSMRFVYKTDFWIKRLIDTDCFIPYYTAVNWITPVTKNYITGMSIGFCVTFKDEHGDYVVPTDVILKILKPSKTIEQYSLSLDEVTLQDNVYSVPFFLSEAGKHVYRWECSGGYSAVEEGFFYVKESSLS